MAEAANPVVAAAGFTADNRQQPCRACTRDRADFARRIPCSFWVVVFSGGLQPPLSGGTRI